MAGAVQVPQKGRWIVVNLPEHKIHVFLDGQEVKTIEHFSVGRPGYLTPLLKDAEIDPDRRYRHHMSGEFHAPMPYSLFFNKGRAFHGGNVRVESHGCVHLNDTDAPWLFEWVGKHKVHVRFIGPYSHKHVQADPTSGIKYA